MPVDQIQRLYQVFQENDRDRSGTMDRTELVNFWRQQLRQEPDTRLLELMFLQFDVQKTGSLTFNEFIMAYGALTKELATAQQLQVPIDVFLALRRNFINWDVSRDGQLSTQELRGFLQLNVSDSELQAMVQSVDQDRSGAVSFSELLPLIAQLSRQTPQLHQLWMNQVPPPQQRVQMAPSQYGMLGRHHHHHGGW
eukprot:TRINITY_DN6990_c0_g1_i1.p2 TRINITY_DN6990_c0_g1~~TRINITY_DN6990_c0_g1_i1.p2  ORF type:complete len:196 (-),score=66.86 TRINITY_DN6990_c0_g1_i1:75-662(-)